MTAQDYVSKAAQAERLSRFVDLADRENMLKLARQWRELAEQATKSSRT